MTVFKYSLKLLLKKKIMFMAYFLVFIIISVFSVQSNVKEDYREIPVNAAYIDNSNTEESRALVKALEANNSLSKYEVSSEQSEIRTANTDGILEQKIKEDLFYAIYDAVFVIPVDFKDKLDESKPAIKFYINTAKTESATKLQTQANSYLSLLSITKTESPAGFVYDNKALSKASKELSKVKLITKGESESAYKTEWLSFFYKVLSYPALTVIIYILGYAMSEILEFNLFRRISMGKISSNAINLQIYLSHTLLGLVVLVLSGVVGISLMGLEAMNFKFYMFCANASVFILAAICLSFFIVQITTSKFIINGLSNVIGLGSSFIIGVFVPKDFLPDKINYMAKFFPTSHYIDAIDEIVKGNIPYFQFGLQALFAVFFLSLGLYIAASKRRTRV